MSFPIGDIKISANFELGVAKHIDSRFYVNTFSDLNLINFKPNGLVTYVESLKKSFLYNGLAWDEVATVNSSSGTVRSVGLTMPNIFSVSNSPITSSGILTANLVSQTQNFIFSAPSGSNGIPSFRSLTSLDIPVLPYLKLDGTTTMLGDLLVGSNKIKSTNNNNIDIQTGIIQKNNIDSIDFSNRILKSNSGSNVANWDGNNLQVYNNPVQNLDVATKQYVDSVSSTSGIYHGASPATITQGGIPAGYVLTNKSFEKILEDMLVVYQNPTFSSFSITGQQTPLEVGMVLNGVKTFTWSTTNSGNISPNTISITNVNTSTSLVSGLSNDGSEVLNIGSITNTTPINQVFRIQATNTHTINFNTTYSITSKYPCFYGKIASGGAISGSNRPSSNQALINSGTKMVLSTNENGTITINFNSTSDDYIWFAVPTIGTLKTKWFETSLNNGVIGGNISPSGNLFPSPDTVVINDPTSLWSGVSYKIYVSNYQTLSTSNLQMQN